ncbi:MAG TPA: FG-GAP-like repeat-containing protein [Candidatus Sulfotelmatobacter sp.]|nr:FG-GAP-like repeat-containing protein [Candidatus Sulfotelmatobacter sp.]
MLLAKILSLLLLCFISGPNAQAQGGNFPTGVNYAVPGQGGVAIGDFNGDNKPDIVIANQNGTVSILLGNGDGTFQQQYTVTAVPATGPYSAYLTESVAIGDFNGDGKMDLAVLCNSPNFQTPANIQGTVNILLGNGDGTFSAPTPIVLDGAQPISILAGDFNHDQKEDLAVLNIASSSVSILLGKGDGSFQPSVDYPTTSQPAAFAIGDVNHDGNLDLAVVGASGNNPVVSVLLGNSNGTFGTAVNWIISGPDCVDGCGPQTTVALGDFNGDGKLDLAVNVSFVGGVLVLLGNGDGTFRTPGLQSGAAFAGVNGANVIVAGDFNGDGKLDLAMAVGDVYPAFPDLLIFLGNGDGTFASPLETSVGSIGTMSGATTVVAADLDGDKFLDLVLATNTGFATGLGYNAVTVVLNCGLRCSNIALSSSPTTSAFNQSVTFTATVTPANAQATQKPTGSVIFQDGTSTPPITLGPATLSSGTATFTYSGLAIGTHGIFAAYQGDTNFVPSTSATIMQTVTQANTSVSINSSPNPSTPGQSVTFATTVMPSTSGVPTGSVTFSDNGTPSVSVQLDAAGSASFTSSSLTTGTHSITWSYSGDSNFAASTSPVLTQIIGTNAAPFAITPSSTSATVPVGQPATFMISLVSIPGFTTPVAFSCSGLPAGSSCQFQPASLTPNGTTLKTVATITTTARHSVLLPVDPWFPAPWAYFRPLSLIFQLGLVFVLIRAKQWEKIRRPAWAGVVWSLVLLITMAATGCGGGSSSTGSTGTPAGTSQVVVTATSGSATQSVTFALTVQ